MASLSTSALLVVTVLSCLYPVYGRWGGRETARLSGLLGAPSEMSKEELQSKPVQHAAQFAVQQLNFGSQPGAAMHVLVRVVSGTSQVVAGMRYKLVLEIGKSQLCKNKDGTATPKDCPIHQSSVKTWNADVWVKPTNPAQYKLMDLEQVYLFSH